MMTVITSRSDTREPDPRSRMITSAAVLFREYGYAATGFRDVIEHSGAPRGSIYHHFPGGKAELAESTVRYAADVIAARIEAAVADDDPVEAVRAFAAGWRRRLERSDFRAGCPVVAVAVEAHDSPVPGAAAAEAFERWEQQLARALRRGGVARARAPRMAALIISAIEGAVVQCRVARSTQPLDDVTRELVAAIEAARA
jgi:AcrR family transcriptional regulator